MPKTLRQLVDVYNKFKEKINSLSNKQKEVVSEFEKKVGEEKIKKIQEKIDSSL